MGHAPIPSPVECRERLQAAGLKATQQRITILRELFRQPGHPSAERVHEAISSDNPGLSLGTVYRTLDVLVDSGLIKRFGGERGKMYFDTNTAIHHHLIEAETEAVEDYHDAKLNTLLQDYFQKNPIPGFAVDSFQLNIRGKSKQRY